MAVSMITTFVLIDTAMKTPLLICSVQTHSGNIFYGRQQAIRVSIVYCILEHRLDALTQH